MNMRQERIEKLLRELQYEVTRGMMTREIEEEMGFRFIVPISSEVKDGVVVCEFRTAPRHHSEAGPWERESRLRLVKK